MQTRLMVNGFGSEDGRKFRGHLIIIIIIIILNDDKDQMCVRNFQNAKCGWVLFLISPFKAIVRVGPNKDLSYSIFK